MELHGVTCLFVNTTSEILGSWYGHIHIADCLEIGAHRPCQPAFSERRTRVFSQEKPAGNVLCNGMQFIHQLVICTACPCDFTRYILCCYLITTGKRAKEKRIMLKKFIIRHSAILLSASLFIGQLSANIACSGPYYQPKVPSQLLKSR